MAATKPTIQAKLIFNATAGRPEESPEQLANIVAEMKRRHIWPEVYVVRPNSRVGAVVRNAIKRGIELVVVAGGDGTIDSVVGSMIGGSGILGIIPTGTRNNTALSLGIPNGIADAVAVLRTGRRVKMDVGHLRSGRKSGWFLEAATLGLLSDLYPVADDIQHGDLTQIGGLLGTFISSSASQLRVILDGRDQVDARAQMVLVANTPYFGPHFRVAPDVSFDDGLLDVLVYSDMSQLDLIAYILQSMNGTAAEDPRVKHYQVGQVAIHSHPAMPVLADGIPLGQGLVTATVRPRALTVIAGASVAAGPVALPAIDGKGVSNE